MFPNFLYRTGIQVKKFKIIKKEILIKIYELKIVGER